MFFISPAFHLCVAKSHRIYKSVISSILERHGAKGSVGVAYSPRVVPRKSPTAAQALAWSPALAGRFPPPM